MRGEESTPRISRRLVALLTHGAGMLWTLFVILLVLWLLGIVSANTFGGFIHVLLWAAIAVVLLGVLQGHRKAS